MVDEKLLAEFNDADIAQLKEDEQSPVEMVHGASSSFILGLIATAIIAGILSWMLLAIVIIRMIVTIVVPTETFGMVTSKAWLFNGYVLALLGATSLFFGLTLPYHRPSFVLRKERFKVKSLFFESDWLTKDDIQAIRRRSNDYVALRIDRLPGFMSIYGATYSMGGKVVRFHSKNLAEFFADVPEQKELMNVIDSVTLK